MTGTTVDPAAGGRLTDLVLLVRPGIVVAVLLTGYAGMVLGQGGIPGGAATVAVLGALGLAVAGAVLLNNAMEQRRDRAMRRLDRRVAALQRLGAGTAVLAGLLLVTAALALALLTTNLLAAALLATAVLTYVPLYTVLFKRLPHGAVPGALPGALPVLIGAAAAGGTLPLPAILLFLTLFLWQPPHFWLLTLRFAPDYRRAGIPVPVTVTDGRYAVLLIRTYLLSLLPASLLLWLLGFCSGRYAALATLAWLPFAVGTWRADDDRRVRAACRYSILYLTLLCLAVVLDHLVTM